MQRAYSILDTKTFDENDTHVTIEGIATTPATDRMGDIVESEGAKFAASIPLLWQHDYLAPIGEVKLGTPTARGIPFTASIPLIREEGTLKARVDEAVQSLKYGLVKAVSIGFRILKDGAKPMGDGGLRISKYEIMELSAVTIPAQAEALITAIKSYDTPQAPASGLKAAGKSAGDSAPRTNTVKLLKGHPK